MLVQFSYCHSAHKQLNLPWQLFLQYFAAASVSMVVFCSDQITLANFLLTAMLHSQKSSGLKTGL